MRRLREKLGAGGEASGHRPRRRLSVCGITNCLWPSLAIIARSSRLSPSIFSGGGKNSAASNGNCRRTSRISSGGSSRRRLDAKAQQQVLFNSMLEGLLLAGPQPENLPRQPRLQKPVRHQDRIARQNRHGSAAPARARRTGRAAWKRKGQVLDYELKLPELNERWLQVNAAVISNSAGEREGHHSCLSRSDAAQAARTHARGIRRQRQP